MTMNHVEYKEDSLAKSRDRCLVKHLQDIDKQIKIAIVDQLFFFANLIIHLLCSINPNKPPSECDIFSIHF